MKELIGITYDDKELVIEDNPSMTVHYDGERLGSIGDPLILCDIGANTFRKLLKEAVDKASMCSDSKQGRTLKSKLEALACFTEAVLLYRGTNNQRRVARDILQNVMIANVDGKDAILAQLGFTDIVIGGETDEKQYTAVRFSEGKYDNIVTSSIDDLIHHVTLEWYASKKDPDLER